MNITSRVLRKKTKGVAARFKSRNLIWIFLCVTLFSCNKDLEKEEFDSQQLTSGEVNEASNTTTDSFTVADLEVISMRSNEVRIQFTASANAQAFIEYGTDEEYGERTKGEESFKYATHRQYIRGLESGTTYFYRVTVTNEDGESATASSSFTTTGGDSNGGEGSSFTVGELEPILVEDTQVRIQFTASAKAQAFIEYGTDTDYGQQTKGEDSFTYAQHRQFIKDLSAGTQYFYRVRVTNADGQTASASSSFTTSGESGEEEEEEEEEEDDDTHGGMSSSYAQIQSQGLSNACYVDNEHYVAEFLFQNPEVYFWEDTGSSVIAVDTPVPSANAIQLPRPSGGNDTGALERIINSNPGKDLVGQGVYKVDNLDINVSVNIFDMPMVPASSGTKRIINVKSRDVGIYNSPVDGQNSNKLAVAYEVQDGAHGFTLVKSGLKDVFHTNGESMSGVVLRGVNDFHIAGNRFENLLNDARGRRLPNGELVTARASGVWMRGGSGRTTSGGYIVNNYGEEFQSNGERRDAEFFVTQGYASTDAADPVRIYANRMINAGKRLVKFQESNGVVLSNYYEWNVKNGRLGNRALLSHVTIHFSDNVFARNNRVKVGSGTNSKFDYLFIMDAKGRSALLDNNHYDCNDILIESNLAPNDRIRPTLITARDANAPKKGTGREGTNCTANNNVLRGPGTIANVYWFGEGYDDRGGRFVHTGNRFEERMITRGEYKRD